MKAPRLLSGFRVDRRGAAAIEMALLLPVTMLTILGIFEVGRAAAVFYSVREAAQMGVRSAILASASSTAPLSQSQLVALVRSRVRAINPADVTVDIGYAGGNVPGGWVTIRATASVKPMAGYVPIPPIPLTSDAKGMILQ